jgi:hypothetical protein
MTTLSSSLFRLIFACYPSELKGTFGDEIVAVFLQDLSDATHKEGVAGAISVWKRAFLEIFGICLPYQFAKSAFVAPVIALFWCSGVGVWLVRRETRILGWPGLIAAAIAFFAARHCSRPTPMRTLQFTSGRH